MADSRALPGFGEVDLEFEDDPGASPSSTATSPSSDTFDIDFDIGGAPQAPAGSAKPAANPFAEEMIPPSTSRVFNVEAKRATRRNLPASSIPARPPASRSVHDESTRIVSGDALGALTRLSSEPPANSHLAEDGNTRAWSEVDDALLAAGQAGADHDEAPPSSRAPSGSGIASHDGRVAAMRELYAKGDAAGALALAATLTSAPPPDIRDAPDASIIVELCDQSVEILDPFGGLIPADEDEGEAPHVLGAAAQLTLTERQSIPRMLKSLAEVSKLKIDHRAGFLLAHVDGMQTLEEILDVCAMPAAEALDVIAKLKEMAVIEFD